MSSSTSQKHRNFVAEPMGTKTVNELPGIGAVLGGRLKELGYEYAYHVLGQFLLLNRNQEQLDVWLKEEVGANAKQSGDCSSCLNEWANNFV